MSAVNNITAGQFIFLDGFKQVCDCFYSLFGIRIAFFTVDGREIDPDTALPCCDYCRIVRNELGLEPLCEDSDRTRCGQAASLGEPIEYICHAGLCEYIVPLRYENKIFGNMMIGQFRTRSNPQESVLQAAHAKGIERQEIVKAFMNVPYVNDERLVYIKRLLGMLTELITLRRMVTNSQRLIVEDILLFMERNPDKNLSLTQAAKICGCGVSTFSSMFREHTGFSFKQYQLTQKLETAEKLLKTRPDLAVKDISEQLGFSDPYHFSKIYKKHRNVSPSDDKITKTQ